MNVPQERRKRVLIAVSPLLVLLAVGAFWLRSSSSLWNEEKLIAWQDEGIALTLWDTKSFDSTLELRIERDGDIRTRFVIDKSVYGTLRAIEYDERIIFTNDQYIFAAYEPKTDRIIEYDELEFTLWEDQGRVVDEFEYGPGPASMRRGFESKSEKPMQPTSREWQAHVRQGRICFVSFDGGNPSE